jgi:hypothetical protein
MPRPGWQQGWQICQGVRRGFFVGPSHIPPSKTDAYFPALIHGPPPLPQTQPTCKNKLSLIITVIIACPLWAPSHTSRGGTGLALPSQSLCDSLPPTSKAFSTSRDSSFATPPQVGLRLKQAEIYSRKLSAKWIRIQPPDGQPVRFNVEEENRKNGEW